MKKEKREFDERQMQDLCMAQSRGFLVMFFLCAASIVFQLIVGKGDLILVAGETVVLAGGGITTLGACIRRGLWKPDGTKSAKKNMVLSFLLGLFFSIVYFMILIKKTENLLLVCALSLGFFAGITLLGLLVLTAGDRITGRIQKKQEEEYCDQEEGKLRD